MYANVNEVFAEVRQLNEQTDIINWADLFRKSPAVVGLQVAGISELMYGSKTLGDVLETLLGVSAIAFEAGRLYGRSQVLSELEKES